MGTPSKMILADLTVVCQSKLMENDLLTLDLRGQRTLATVLFTDCVGFSARMSVDEDHTLDLIRRDLKLMKQVCKRYEGRVLKSTGDGLLMCFISVVKAVECAVEIQTLFAEHATTLSPEDTLQHRIGIHLADIFISETDVMGNGVNIAARLQTEADPGGICISQTVWDVIQASLHLRTKFLGPKELKNIREIVPVYKILLKPEEEVTDPYTEVIQILEAHPDLPRIKKLLFYVCKSTWESSQTRLSNIQLHTLVQELLEMASTPEKMKVFLDAAVKTLSKQTEYALVAKTVLAEVGKLCFNQPRQSAASLIQATVASNFEESTQAMPISVYLPIAQVLEQSEDCIRIKKLLVYVCNSRWENDLEQLSQVRLDDQLATLHRLTPTLEQLRSRLDKFVQTLSKQTEYSLIANQIINRLMPLYEPNSDATSLPRPTILTQPPPETPIECKAEEQNRLYNEVVRDLGREPNLLRIKKLMLYVCWQQWENDPVILEGFSLGILVRELHHQATTLKQLELAVEGVVSSLNKQTEYRAISQTILLKFRPLYFNLSSTRQCEPAPEQHPTMPPAFDDEPKLEPSANPDLKNLSITSSPHPSDTYPHSPNTFPPQAVEAVPLEPSNARKLPVDLFDYRQGIMKYANPLRAKILLFSALNQDFGFTQTDWLNLKMHDMDDLLHDLLATCPTYTGLEAVLYSAAKRLREPEEQVEIASTLIQCLRPLYIHGRPTIVLEQSLEETRVDSEIAKPRVTDIDTEIDLDSEDSFTRQIQPSSPDSTRVATPVSTPAESKPQVELLSTIQHTENQPHLYPPSHLGVKG
jgi:class 3 adenylate cyclase